MHHGVDIADGALVTGLPSFYMSFVCMWLTCNHSAVVYSTHYISDQFFPNKAIDQVDEATSALCLTCRLSWRVWRKRQTCLVLREGTMYNIFSMGVHFFLATCQLPVHHISILFLGFFPPRSIYLTQPPTLPSNQRPPTKKSEVLLFFST